ncbi:unnamed protein product [Periconia digitata]|uniref:Potassium transport protein n=1 Tax=Periconia digitata TaxID=1303443 RepID=A0A9W4UMX8_9PLEO|nr:unnamed protein product [Periconia digitata]
MHVIPKRPSLHRPLQPTFPYTAPAKLPKSSLSSQKLRHSLHVHRSFGDRNMFARVPGLGRFRRLGRSLQLIFPSLNFITLHYLYFLITCLLASVIFWGASTPARSVSYVDALFLTVSAMTLAGLNTVNLSTLNTFQQWMLFFLIMIGSAIFVSGFVVHIRKRAFEKRFAYIVAKRRRGSERRSRSSLRRRLSRSRSRLGARDVEHDTGDPYEQVAEASGRCTGNRESITAHNGSMTEKQPPSPNPVPAIEAGDEIHSSSSHVPNASPSHITFDPNIHNLHRFNPVQGVETEFHAMTKSRSETGTVHEVSEAQPDRLGSAHNPLPVTSGFILSRNSSFHHLSEQERQKLGGYEYRAVCLLSWLVPIYYILFQLVGCIGLGAYVAINRPLTARANGLNPWWVGAFNAVSAFNNSGMSLLDANMIAFQTSIYMLLTMGLLILAGNTCYPIFLRLIVWTLLKLLPSSERWTDHRKTLEFLLNHPRRCYTNLFPSQHTWWLAACVICLNGIDWAGFEVLNIGNHAINSLPTNIQVLDGLFQALAVRSGGFYVVPIPSVRISLQVLYVIMMYISVYPVVITMRNSNVYEERSLGIYSNGDQHHNTRPFLSAPTSASHRSTAFSLSQPLQNTYFVRAQLRAQLAHDLWIVVLAIFLISIIEASNFERDPTLYSVFNILFETVSAYACVGVSIGVPYDAYSFSGALHALSKLVLCAVMISGRHRGLPVAIDKAILLPGEGADGAEEEDGERRLEGERSRGRGMV